MLYGAWEVRDTQMTADMLPREKMDSKLSVFIGASKNYKKTRAA